MKTLIISPHLDDALFSLSALLQGHIVIATVFTQEHLFKGLKGLKGAYAAYADMKTRKKEDIAAFHFLTRKKKNVKIEYIHLDFPDKLFRKNDAIMLKPLREELRELYNQNFDKIYCPLGVGGHPDHLLVFEMCQVVFGNRAAYYCEYPYSGLKLNRVKRFNALGLKHDLRLKWQDYIDYYRHPIYASTLGIVRLYRMCHWPFGTRENTFQIIKYETDVAFKGKLVSHYQTQIEPIFGSAEHLEKELQKNKIESVILF
jgi:hypothetical protein